MHATAFLKNPNQQSTGPMVVLHGNQGRLKQDARQAVIELVLGPQNGDAVSRFDGRECSWQDVHDELATVSMWGEKRLVFVEEAGEFVSANRAALEKYIHQPSRKSVLMLDVKSWPKTTRLAKQVGQLGLELACTEMKPGELTRWLTDLSRRKFGKQLPGPSARLMVELAGTDLGLLQQELAKLAAYVGEREKIGADDVQTLVGGWKAQTTWAMIDAVRDGELATALKHLEKLLQAGEAPQRILGGINYVFRKLIRATELSRQGQRLTAALEEAGIFRRDLQAWSQYLRRVGRPRAERFATWLQTADSNLKGGSRLPERTQLEHLLVLLSGQDSAQSQR